MADKKIIDVVGATGAGGGGLVRANERKSFGIYVGVALTQVASALAEGRAVAYGHSCIAPAS